MEIRTKDKIFLAVVVPIVVVFAYVWLWRAEAVQGLARLSAQERALVGVEDFPQVKRTEEQRLLSAERERTLEREQPPTKPLVVADPAARVAERDRKTISVFREMGLLVLKADDVTDGQKTSRRAMDVLKATGALPQPVLRRYRLEGGYPAVRRSLRAFAEREMAVVVERVSMTEDGKWEVDLNE